MPGLDSFLWGGPAALVIAAATFVVARYSTRRPAVAWSAAVVAGFAAGALALDAHANGFAVAAGRLVKPVEAHGRLPLIALAAVVPGILAAATGRRWTLWLLATPVAVLAPLWLLWGGRYFPRQELRDAGFADGAWGAGQAVAIIGGVAVAILAAWWAWRRVEPASLPLVRTAVPAAAAIGGAAATVACTGSITYAHALALLAIAVAACGGAAWLTKSKTGPEAAAGPIVVMAGCLLLLAVGYSELHLWQAAALGAIIAASAGWLPGANRGPIKRGAIRAAIVLVPLSAIVGQAAYELAASQRLGGSDAAVDPYTAYDAP